jgi:hypothetical protein
MWGAIEIPWVMPLDSRVMPLDSVGDAIGFRVMPLDSRGVAIEIPGLRYAHPGL